MRVHRVERSCSSCLEGTLSAPDHVHAIVSQARPTCFLGGLWIFKEGIGFHKRVKATAGQQSDRWHNSGGSKAARFLPLHAPIISRRYVARTRVHCVGCGLRATARLYASLRHRMMDTRYGNLKCQNARKYRYNEYRLVCHNPMTGDYDENCGVSLYHVMLPLENGKRLQDPP